MLYGTMLGTKAYKLAENTHFPKLEYTVLKLNSL